MRAVEAPRPFPLRSGSSVWRAGWCSKDGDGDPGELSNRFAFQAASGVSSRKAVPASLRELLITLHLPASHVGIVTLFLCIFTGKPIDPFNISLKQVVGVKRSLIHECRHVTIVMTVPFYLLTY